MALLRAIGASRRQVLGSVLLEAVVVGLIASVVGLVAGIGVAVGCSRRCSPASASTSPPAASCVEPARRSSCRWSPGSASAWPRPCSRPAGPPKVAADRRHARRRRRHVGRSRRRVVVGIGVTGARGRRHGQPACSAAAASRSVGLGAPLVFVGVAVLGPVARPPDQPGDRCAAAPAPGHGRDAGPGERHAEPQAHVGHGRGADDRRRPGRRSSPSSPRRPRRRSTHAVDDSLHRRPGRRLRQLRASAACSPDLAAPAARAARGRAPSPASGWRPPRSTARGTTLLGVDPAAVEQIVDLGVDGGLARRPGHRRDRRRPTSTAEDTAGRSATPCRCASPRPACRRSPSPRSTPRPSLVGDVRSSASPPTRPTSPTSSTSRCSSRVADGVDLERGPGRGRPR